MKYVAPKVYGRSFTCPHCGAISNQVWWGISWDGRSYGNAALDNLRIGKCQHCEENTVWVKDKMCYPDNGTASFPNSEMPESVKNIYLEAASIQAKSPRGAAALLRLGIQILCKELGEDGKNINTDIGNLVKKGYL